ncbi:MAG: NAD(P)H-binding protein, partial [Cyanobacteria bacterium P01_H01_bin.130]
MAGSSAGPVPGPVTNGGRALILGCGYVGTAIAQHWRAAGITVTATTTREERVKDLEATADRVIVLDATEPEKLREALEGQDTVLMCIGAKGPSDYRHAYLECAEALVSAIPEFPSIQQVIYTGTFQIGMAIVTGTFGANAHQNGILSFQSFPQFFRLRGIKND